MPAMTAVAVLAVGGVVYLAAHGQPPHATVDVLVAAAPLPAISSPPSVPVGTPSPSPSPQPARRPVHHRAQHRVTPAAFVVTDTGAACYVQVTSRHGRLIERTILHGHQHLTYRRHGLGVVLGNAGGVRIAIDGHHAHRAGHSGQVLVLHVR